MNTKLLLLMVVGIALVCSGSVSALWWNSSYSYKYHIDNNASLSTPYAYVVNDTSCIGGHCIHALIANSSWVYSTASGPSGKLAVANDTDERPWFNGTDCSGHDTSNVYAGAVGVWCFDANSGNTTIDCSGKSNTGTCKNMRGGSGTTDCNWSDGVFGHGIEFDGVDDYVDCGNADLTCSQVTWEAWVKADDVNTYQVVLALGVGGGVANTGDVRVQNGNVDAYWHGPGSVAGGRLGSITLSTGTWYHVAVIYESGEYPVLYINGTAEGSTTGTAQTLAGTSWQAYVGKTLYADAATPFNGMVDEPRIYNRTLSPEEIQEHYQNWNNRTNFGAEEEPPAVTTFNVSINSPSDNTVTSDNTTSHNFTAIGLEATYDCTLYYNDSSKGTNASVLNNTATVITSTEVSNGVYSWYVNCTSGSTTNQSKIYTITIQSGMPSINAPTIIPATLYETQECTGLTTATDDTTAILILNYSWLVDDVIKISGNKSILNNNQSCVPELGAGNYSSTNVVNITVRVWDGTFWSFENSSEVTVSALPTGNGVAKERFIIRHGGML